MPLTFCIVFIMLVNILSTSIQTTTSCCKRKLSGHCLVFAYFDFPPFNRLIVKPDGNYTHGGGTSAMINEWLAERLNFTLSYKYLNLPGSNIQKAISLVASKEIDGIGSGFVPTLDRLEKMDFAHFVWFEPYTMIVPRPGEEPRLFAFIAPFQPQVWLLISVAVFVVVCSMTCFAEIYFNNSKQFENGRTLLGKREKFSKFDSATINAVYVAKTITNQGGREPTSRLSFRFLVGVWLLVAMVLVNSYSSTVISYLTVPRIKSMINSFEDLAASADVSLVLQEDIVISQQILEAKSGIFKILGDQTRRRPDQLFTNVTKALAKLRTGHFAFPYMQSFSKFFVGDQFKKSGQCNFKSTDPLPLFAYWSLPLQKESQFTNIFTVALTELWETGLTTHWVSSLFPLAPKCFAKTKPQALGRLRPIQLNDLIGIFLVFGLGIGLSIAILVVEFIVAYIRNTVA